MKKLVFIFGIIAALIVGSLIAYYTYNKPHIDIQKKEADFELDADVLLDEFLTDIDKANQKYSGKIVSVKGKLNEQFAEGQPSTSFLIFGERAIVNCELDSTMTSRLKGLKKGHQISVKGLFIGYDDLLEELQIKKCIIE